MFDADWYVYCYPDVACFPRGPLYHFCRYGIEELRNPSPNFDSATYVLRHPEAMAADVPVFLYALDKVDDPEHAKLWLPTDDFSLGYLLRSSGFFEERWYLAMYRDIALSKVDPFHHFLERGAQEMRNPGPGFDSEFYRDEHRDYRDWGRTPIESFLRFGRANGHQPKGRTKYGRWVARFDELTDADIERMARDAGPGPKAVTGLQIVDPEACSRFDDVLHSWASQVGVECQVRFVRAGSLSDAQWGACVGGISSLPRSTTCAPDVALADIPEGGMLVLSGGASLLRPHAGYVLTETLSRQGADAVYADHDHVDPEGVRTMPVFKPAMSPEFMRHLPYAGSVVAAVLRDTSRQVLSDGIRRAAEGGASEAWASVLLGLEARRIGRAPFLLYHRPGLADEFAEPIYEPVPASPPAEVSPPAEASPPGAPPSIHGGDPPSVTVIIPTRGRADLLRECIDSILSRTDYPRDRYVVMVVDNDTADAETLAYLDDLRGREGFEVVASPGSFNFSTICNDGAAAARSDVLVFLNNDTTVNRSDWLSKLVEQASRPDGGAVGGAAAVPGRHRPARRRRAGGSRRRGSQDGRVPGVARRRDRCHARDDVDDGRLPGDPARGVRPCLGGFDPVLRVSFNDVGLCAKVFTAGHRNIYVAEPLLYHHESKSRGYEDTRPKRIRSMREAIYVRERYGALFQDDPSYSPNLSLPDDRRSRLASACRQAVAAFARSGRAVCCS